MMNLYYSSNNFASFNNNGEETSAEMFKYNDGKANYKKYKNNKLIMNKYFDQIQIDNLFQDYHNEIKRLNENNLHKNNISKRYDKYNLHNSQKLYRHDEYNLTGRATGGATEENKQIYDGGNFIYDDIEPGLNNKEKKNLKKNIIRLNPVY